MAEVSRSGYYNWCKGDMEPDAHEISDLRAFQMILAAYRFRGYDKGVMGIYMRLLRSGIRMNHKKIRRLMRKYGLLCPIRKANPYRRMMKALKSNAVADNHLNREFRKYGPRKVCLTDITYIPYNGKFCYLSVIKDAFTKEVLSYVLSRSLEVDFVLETVNKLIRDHGFTLDDSTMIHSDQGAHYTSIEFRKLISDLNLRQSMSRRGNCWDNAPQESFFGHMKQELQGRMKSWKSFEEVQSAIDDWMDYYNNDRYQVGLLKMSPTEYYSYIITGKYPEGLSWYSH